jgi:hypothetical protein
VASDQWPVEAIRDQGRGDKAFKKKFEASWLVACAHEEEIINSPSPRPSPLKGEGFKVWVFDRRKYDLCDCDGRVE